jgi:hypothetical protein
LILRTRNLDVEPTHNEYILACHWAHSSITGSSPRPDPPTSPSPAFPYNPSGTDVRIDRGPPGSFERSLTIRRRDSGTVNRCLRC